MKSFLRCCNSSNFCFFLVFRKVHQVLFTLGYKLVPEVTTFNFPFLSQRSAQSGAQAPVECIELLIQLMGVCIARFKLCVDAVNNDT